MSNGLEITKETLDQFCEIQEYMLCAKKENATETYAALKKKYKVLKAFLNVAGINLDEIDIIKE